MAEGSGVNGAVTGGSPASSGQVSDQAALTQIKGEEAQATATAQRNDPEDPTTGGINPRTAQAKMLAAEAATTTATGAGFEFTPEQVEIQLEHCKEQISDLQLDLQSAQDAELAVHAPAPDQASVAQADAVRSMLTNTIAVIRADIVYLTDWQTKLNQAKTNYVNTEHLTEDQWSQLTKGLQA